MDIKIGEYVRTRDGKIDKVINPEFYIETYIECQKGLVTKDAIKGHSPNIIDLIEEEDYVNGIKIYSIKKGIGYGDKGQVGIIINKHYSNCKFIPVEDIKTIVTSEQFKAMEYEV